MRHLKAGRRLGRNASHRLALFRNLAVALFQHERIVTTLAKAKAARPFIEKIITLAKRGDQHAQRMVEARLGPAGNAAVKPGDEPDSDNRKVLVKLFKEIGPRFKDRPGGYTRIIKRHERRLGDAGHTAFLELLKAGEAKVQARQPAPPPRVEAPPPAEEPPTPETPAAAPGPEATAPPPPQETPPAEGAAPPPPQETPPAEGSAPPAGQESPPAAPPPQT